ncbi:DUF3568 domain-containing protein [Pseudodesulfovibrio sp. zrk46]|uniref:DUF3568 domain-containing protein n=1 Tax=Pseudodesulfovibrio sp. zrk46 TaxID=2725288 RepID=UPI00144995FD|nr:DUF3568 domain-containing protein [Pseudodesulfovibrio sp. zrk46]QJB55969.1 DUF3568 domain-containing protein [Pseudodesulfovibrio sp. zrk46]
MRIVLAAALLSVFLMSVAGCGAVIVGGGAALGTYAYVNGDAVGSYDSSLDNAYAASKAACSELGIPIVKERKDNSEARIQGKMGGDTVTIALELVGMDITEISVRVGLFGQEDAARRIHNAITSRL